MLNSFNPPSRQQSALLSSPDIITLILSANICALVIAGFISSSDQFTHWFVIPIFLCGVLIGVDAVDWFRGRIKLLDPVGVIGLLGFHFFFLAPLLHVHWDHWMRYVQAPPDWRVWLGGMAILNFLGLLAYRGVRSLHFRTGRTAFRQTLWKVDHKRFMILIGFGLFTTAVLQAWVYDQYGGILGYITTFEENITAAAGFTGMGWIFMISESFPKLAIIGYAVYAQRNKALRSWGVLVLVMVVFLALSLLFGGFRGSRSNTLWALLFAVGVIHLWIRPVPKFLVYLGMVFLVLFTYAYGFYKAVGIDALMAFEGAEARAELEEQTGRTLQVVLLGDFGRSDVQALLLYRTIPPSDNYKYAWGRTYLGAGAFLVPRAVWPERPINKAKEGTEAQYGMGSYVPGGWTSSRIYGLAGETMLNFGPLAIPLAFMLFGLVVKQVRFWLLSWKYPDTRLFIFPLLVNASFLFLGSDVDNVLFFLVKNGTLPVLVVLLGSKKVLSDNVKEVRPSI